MKFLIQNCNETENYIYIYLKLLNFQATAGAKITLVLDDFNVEWNKNCDENDYLFVSQIKLYTKVNLKNSFSYNFTEC